MTVEVSRKPHQALAWTATAITLIGAVLASLDIYPWSVYVFIAGNGTWILVGSVWKEKTLISMNVLITIIYFAGLIGHRYFM